MAGRLPLQIAAGYFMLLGAARSDDAVTEKMRMDCPGFSDWEQHKALPQPESNVASVKDPVLRSRLLAMVKEDQDARAQFASQSPGDPRGFMKVDARNLSVLRKVFHQHGVPSVSLIGSDGVGAFWLLIQHADADVPLQAQVLKQIARQKTAIPPDQIALLTDRVRVNQHRLQLYGSQFTSSPTGWVPQPIEDAEHVDARRQSVGLMPLAVYSCAIKVMYPNPP